MADKRMTCISVVLICRGHDGYEFAARAARVEMGWSGLWTVGASTYSWYAWVTALG